MIPHNIILTGMPGSGKSTVGVILAKELLMNYIDTDVLIQTREGSSLQDIVDSRGIESLLDIEERVAIELVCVDTVIAPGGSVVLRPDAIDALRKLGTVVFLDVPVERIATRIDMYSRGMVKEPDDTLADVWRKREPLYRATADIIIDCNGHDQMTITRMIVEALQNR